NRTLQLLKTFSTMPPIAKSSHYDYLVIGGGSGGLASARRAGSYGFKVGIIESSASIAEALHDAQQYGFDLSSIPQFNWNLLKQKRDAYIKRLNSIYVNNLAKDNVEYIEGKASFISKNVLRVERDGQVEEIEAKKILIATGGRPHLPSEIPGFELGITSDGFFDLEEQPKKVLVVGTGYIGVELAGIFNTLEGIRVLTHASVKSLSRDSPAGPIKVSLTSKETNDTVEEFDTLLWAIGRTPNVDLNLDAIGVKLNDKGYIISDEYQNTTTEEIYALGDVCGVAQLTPGRRLSDRLFGPPKFKESKLDYNNIPTVVFHGTCGTVGLTEPEARKKFGDENVKTYTSKFVNLYYAMTEQTYKLVVVGEEEKVVGVHLVGKDSAEIVIIHLPMFVVPLNMPHAISFGTIRTTLILSDGQCPPNVMDKILNDNLDYLQQMLDAYDKKTLAAPPAPASDKAFDLTETSLSSLLLLDSSVCKNLIRSFKEENVTWEQWSSDELREKIIQHYFEERINVIEILCYLFFLALDPDKVYHELAIEIIQNHFLDDTFKDRIFDQFKRKSQQDVPQNFLDADLATLWATQSVKEQKVLLDLLFLRYAVQSPDQSSHLLLLKFLNHSISTRFCRDQPTDRFLDPIGKEIVSQAHDLSQILVIIILFVEFNVDIILPSAPSLFKRPASQQDIMAINEVALKMGNDQTHGIFLWVWSSYLSHLQTYFDETSWPYAYQELETIVNSITREFGVKAFKLNVIKYIHFVLTGSCFRPEEPYVTGYKLVFKHFFMSIFEAYEVNHLPNYEGLVECFALVFGEYGPCKEFWEEDFDHPKRRSLLDLAIARFPQQFGPLIRLLTALSANSDSAKYVFEFLQSFSVCCYLANDGQINVVESGQYVVLSCQPIKIFDDIYQKTITIPQGTYGNIVSLTNGNKIVRWKFNYSAWHLFGNMLESFPVTQIDKSESISPSSGDTILSRIRDILQLLQTILTYAPNLVKPFIEHLEAREETIKYYADFPSIIFAVIKHSFHLLNKMNHDEIELIACCLRCLRALLPHFGNEICSYLKQSKLLPEIVTTGETINYTQSIDQLQYLLMERECIFGNYPVTLAFLDLVIRILGNIEQVELVPDTGSPLDVLHSCTYYVLNAIFVSYDHWRYNNSAEHIQVGHKCLEIFNRIMLGCPPVNEIPKHTDPMISTKESPLQNSLRKNLSKSFLNDGGLYHALPLFSIIERGKEHRHYVERVPNYQMSQDSTELQELTLSFLLRLLKTRIKSAEVSWMEVNLLERSSENNNNNRLVAAIASFIKRTDNLNISILSCELLTLLFELAIKALPKWTSLGSLLGSDSESKNLINIFLHRLKTEVQAPTLQVAILNFFTISTHAQIGLIIQGSHIFSDVFDRKGKSKVTDATSFDSIIRIVLDFLQDWENLQQEKPFLLLATIRFLDVLWENSRNFDKSILQTLREDNKFWDNLAAILFGDLDTKIQPHKVFDLVQDHLISDVNNMVAQVCCHLNIKARVLRILAHEIYILTSFNSSKDANDFLKAIPSGGLRTIFAEIKDSDKLTTWLKDFTRIDYDSTIQRSLYDIRERSFPWLKLQRLTIVCWNEDYDLSHIYGDNYMYDINLARKLLSLRNNSPDSERLLHALCKENHHWSRIDAQVVLLRSWKYLMEAASDRLAGVFWTLKNKSDVSWPILKGIAERIEEETRDGHIIMMMIRDDLASLLLRLLERLSTSEESSILDHTIHYAELINLLHNGIMSVIFPIRDSVLERSTPPFHRPLLQSLLLCLRALRNTDSLLSRDKSILPGFQSTCRSLLTEISALLESLMSRKVNDNAIDEDILTLVAILEKLIHPLCNPYPTVWLKILEDHHIIQLLLNTFTYSLSLPWKDRAIYTDSVMYFLLSLANVPVAAKQLYHDGIMTEFCNNRLSQALQKGDVQPNSKEDRHQVWCFMLAVVTSILCTIESKEKANYLRNVVGFVNLFNSQILHAMTCELPINMPYLEEIQRTTMLFHQLALHIGPLGEIEISRYYEESLTTLLAKINYLFTHPKTTSLMVLPLTPDEKEQSATPVSDGIKSAFQKAMPQVNVTSPGSYEMNRFMQRVQQKLLIITRNILATFIHLANSKDVLTMSIPIWSEQCIYFEPLIKGSDDEPATIATLLELMDYGLTLLELWELSISSDQIDDWQFWRVTWKTTTTFIEMTFVLATSQLTSSFYSEPHKRKDIQDLMTDVKSRMVNVQRLIKKLLDTGARIKTEEQELKSVEIVLRGLQQFISKAL
ncbi:3105_t:CDS:2, partial [Racocetra fulgida]